MKREEAEQIFLKKEVFPQWQISTAEIRQALNENQAEILDSVKKVLCCVKILAEEQKMNQGFLVFALHRMSLMEGKYENRIWLYDENFYFGRFFEAKPSLDLPILWEHFHNLWIHLERESKKYIGKIDQAFLRNIMMKLAWHYQREFSLWMAEEIKGYSELEYEWLRTGKFEAWIGEYMGRMNPIR